MASKTQAWPLAKSKQTKVSWAPKQLKNFFPISANMPTCIGLANLCQIISNGHVCWHLGSPSHSQGILRFRRPGTLSNILRITLHYGTNQRGPTIKVPLAVANYWPIMHINSRAGWKQSGLQEHRRLVRLEASYQSQFLVWPRRRRSQSNNQTSTLIFCYNHYLKKMNIMKRSLSWSHWPGSHWNGSTPIKSELCGFPSTCLQVRKINTNLLNLLLLIQNPSWVHSPILHLGEVPCSFTKLRWFLDIKNQHVAFYGGFGCQLPPSVWILGGSAKWSRLLFVKVGFIRINVGFGSNPGK